jgi:ADP-heptose:LPS heptosyltransferase
VTDFRDKPLFARVMSSLYAIKVGVYVLLDTLVCIGRARNNVSETLCLVRVDNIGDFVLWLDAARQIRMHFNHRRIVLVANSTFSELASVLPYWDEVISVDVKRFSSNYAYRHKLMWKIRRLCADTIIHPTISRMFLTGDSIVRISGAKTRIGAVGDLSNISSIQQKISNNWYTMLHRVRREDATELEKNVNFLNALGIGWVSLSVAYIPEIAGAESGCGLVGEYFIVFPGASWRGKMWPEQMFSQCADYLHLKFGWKAVVCGGIADVGLCERICEGIHTHKATNLSGRTSLVGLVEVIRKARILIGNDTSAVHIASAVNIPSVCVLGGGHFGRFVPYPENATGIKPEVAAYPMPCFGCNWLCIYPIDPGRAMPCVQSVELDAVLIAVDRALASVECAVDDV